MQFLRLGGGEQQQQQQQKDDDHGLWVVLRQSVLGSLIWPPPSTPASRREVLHHRPLPSQAIPWEAHHYQSSSGGWLPLTESMPRGRIYDAFLLNPVTGNRLVLPPLETSWHWQYRVAFSSAPLMRLHAPQELQFRSLQAWVETGGGCPANYTAKAKMLSWMLSPMAILRPDGGWGKSLVVLDNGRVEKLEMDVRQDSDMSLSTGMLYVLLVESKREIFLVMGVEADREYELSMEVEVFRPGFGREGVGFGCARVG